MKTKKLFKFHWDCGRVGNIDGLFIATQEEVDKAIGEDLHFGEILGKHSDVCGTLEKNEVEEIEASSEFIAEAEKLLGTNLSGYNPLEYLYDENDY